MAINYILVRCTGFTTHALYVHQKRAGQSLRATTQCGALLPAPNRAGAPCQLNAPTKVASCRKTKLDQNGAARYGVPHALHPRSINVMRESPTTPRPPWHAFICRQFAPTRATSARDASNRYKHSSLTSCAQRQCVRSLRRPEPSTCTQKEVEPEGCKRSTHIARNEHPINQPYGF